MKNVIISRNGPNSLHKEWLKNSDTKNWDLILLFYDEDSYGRAQIQEGKSFFYPGGKWEAYYNFFQDYPEILNDYDYFWFTDDDISLQGNKINKMFQKYLQIYLSLFYLMALKDLRKDDHLKNLIIL